jgi:dipeptidyl aminopeptidase/acylaminoacyl peptidase
MPSMQTLILVLIALSAVILLGRRAIHQAYRAPRLPERVTPRELNLPSQTVHIPTENGKHLFAWFIPPPEDRESGPAVALMHGWGGNAGQMLPFAALLHRAGFACLLLDARNHGHSDSDTFSSMPRFAEDLERGLDWLARQPRIDPQRLFLLGHSVGAGAALLVASRRHDLAGVISIAAFAHPVELMRRQMRSHHIPYLPVGWLVLRYIERTIRASYEAIAPCHTIRLMSCPVLLIHGEQDARVPVADALRIYRNRRDDRVELLLLPDVGHDSGEAIEPYGDSLLSFLGRCGASGPP